MNTADLEEVFGDHDAMEVAAAEARLIFATMREMEELRVPVQRAYEGWHTITPKDFTVLNDLVKKYGFRSILNMLSHMARMRSHEIADLADVIRERGLESRAEDIGSYCREWDRLSLNLETMRTPRLYSIPDMEWEDPKSFVLDNIYEIKEEKTPFE